MQDKQGKGRLLVGSPGISRICSLVGVGSGEFQDSFREKNDHTADVISVDKIWLIEPDRFLFTIIGL